MIQINSYLELLQNEIRFYLTKIRIEDLILNYNVDVYNPSSEEGYQRSPIPTHYKKFAKFILDNKDDFIMPQSILAAVNKSDYDDKKNCLEISSDLKIVDGQHRLEGFKYLRENYKEEFDEIKNIEIPVTIMITDEKSKKIEIETFINLNSKGKRISTDLAINILEKIKSEKSKSETRGEFKTNITDIKENAQSVAVMVSKMLNKDRDSLWYDAIVMTTGESYKVISLNAMQKSLTPICAEIMLKQYLETDFNFSYKTDEISKMIVNYINEVWDINKCKWGEAFIKTEDSVGDKGHKYNKEYNIQKGIGLFSLHIIFRECLEQSNNVADAIQRYKQIIESSEITVNKWKIGGEFSTYNSQAGFKKLAGIIKG